MKSPYFTKNTIFISLNIHINTQAHTHIHTLTHIYVRIHAYARTYAHTHTYTHTHTHTHTHIHKHTDTNKQDIHKRCKQETYIPTRSVPLCFKSLPCQWHSSHGSVVCPRSCAESIARRRWRNTRRKGRSASTTCRNPGLDTEN